MSFTEEQYADLEYRYGLVPRALRDYPVRDGSVRIGDTIWWRSINGPVKVVLKLDSPDYFNILSFPRFYQISEPLVDEDAVSYRECDYEYDNF